MDRRLTEWAEALAERHMADLTFPEVRRALQALSSLYVERRGKLDTGAALHGAGKRAAFALYFGPLHLQTVAGITRVLEKDTAAPRDLVELGCGTGTSLAGWALRCSRDARLRGIDRNAWAVDEARWNWRALGLNGRATRGTVETWRPDARADAVLLAYIVNELSDAARAGLLEQLVALARRGCRILVVEPIARRVSPWWDDWARTFDSLGGRDDDWQFDLDVPARTVELGRAAGLDVSRIKARSLYLNPGRP